MELRMILYGYRKEFVNYFIDESEAAIVREVFDRYISGETLLQIANNLSERKVVYYKDKCSWTKNAVKRILDNSHYCGDMEYPAIITKEIFEKAREKRLSKSGVREKDTEDIAWLKGHSFCKQCGSKFSRRTHWSKSREKWGYGCGCDFDIYIDDKFYFSKIVAALNKVINDPETLKNVESMTKYQPTLEIIKEEKEINRLFEQPNPQFKTVKAAIFHNISNKYKEIKCDTSGEFTNLLIDFYAKLSPLTTLDFQLFKKTVKNITVKRSGEIEIQFINNAVVESEEIENGTNSKSTFEEDNYKDRC